MCLKSFCLFVCLYNLDCKERRIKAHYSLWNPQPLNFRVSQSGGPAKVPQEWDDRPTIMTQQLQSTVTGQSQRLPVTLGQTDYLSNQSLSAFAAFGNHWSITHIYVLRYPRCYLKR